MIYLTSDLHFGHDREFVYRPRGFSSIEEMNSIILYNWNNLITDEDDVYILGDLMLGNNDIGMILLSQLRGKLHIILGNHDTDNRKALYESLPHVVEITYATMLKYRKYHFYLSHYPTMTGNLEKESLHQMTLNLFGHTHSKEKFYNDMPFMYNVAMDANNCTPVSLDTIIDRMKAKVQECVDFL